MNGANIPETENIFTVQRFNSGLLFLVSLNFPIFFLQGEQFVFHEDWGETLVSKSCPVLCVLDIEGSNVSVLEGVPEDISPGQVSAIVFFFFPFGVCFNVYTLQVSS